jgi:hypothetical protein
MSHYWGVYMLQEPVTRDKHRVPIEKYEPEIDPSGVPCGLRNSELLRLSRIRLLVTAALQAAALLQALG